MKTQTHMMMTLKRFTAFNLHRQDADVLTSRSTDSETHLAVNVGHGVGLNEPTSPTAN